MRADDMRADDMRDDRSDLDPAAMPPDRARQVDRDTQRDAKPVADREVARPPADRETSQVETDDRTALFEPTQLSEFKGRWSEIQAGFVDAPQRAVQEADALVADVIARITDSFGRERTQLERHWDRGGSVSTEELRQALRRYRSFFSRLLTL